MLARAVSHRAAPFAVAAATALVQLPIFDRFFSAMDEGHILQFADLVRNGGLIYRDATSYPLPGAFYLLALFFELFRPSILLARWIVLVEFALFAAALFLWVRPLLRPWMAVALVGGLWIYRIWAFPHWQMYSYSSTSLLVLVGSVLLALRFLDSGRRGPLALSGLVFGLGVFCKQDYGAAFLVAILATLVVEARTRPVGERAVARSLITFLAPAAGVGALAGLHFWMQGQLGLVIQMTVLNHFIGLSSYTYEAHPGLLPLFQQDPILRASHSLLTLFPSIVEVVHGLEVRESAFFNDTALYDTAIKSFIYGPHALVAYGAWDLWRRRGSLAEPDQRSRALRRVALFATVAATDVLAATYRPQDYVHLAILYWPLVCVAAVYVDDALDGPRRRIAVVGLLGPAVAAVAVYSVWLGVSLRGVFSEPIAHERAGVYVKPAEARLLVDLDAYIRQGSRPDEPVAIVPYFPLAHFLAERPSPHGAAYIVWPFAEYPDRDRRIVDAMEQSRTPLVIYNFTQFPNFPPVSEYAPELYDYLAENFEIDRVFSYEAFGYSIAGLRRQVPRPGEPLPLDRVSLRVDLRGASRAIPPGRRAKWLVPTTWPFRRALALQPAQVGPTVASFPVERVPPNTRLETAVAVHPKLWFRHPPVQAYFRVAIDDGESTRVVATRTLDPHILVEDRGWFDVRVPLDAYAGRSIRIELSNRLSGAVPAEDALLMAGWAEPRLVTEP